MCAEKNRDSLTSSKTKHRKSPQTHKHKHIQVCICNQIWISAIHILWFSPIKSDSPHSNLILRIQVWFSAIKSDSTQSSLILLNQNWISANKRESSRKSNQNLPTQIQIYVLRLWAAAALKNRQTKRTPSELFLSSKKITNPCELRVGYQSTMYTLISARGFRIIILNLKPLKLRNFRTFMSFRLRHQTKRERDFVGIIIPGIAMHLIFRAPKSAGVFSAKSYRHASTTHQSDFARIYNAALSAQKHFRRSDTATTAAKNKSTTRARV